MSDNLPPLPDLNRLSPFVEGLGKAILSEMMEDLAAVDADRVSRDVPAGWSVEPFWPKSRSLDMPPMFRVFRARHGTVDEWLRGPSGRVLSFHSTGAAHSAILHRMQSDHATAPTQPQPVQAQPSEAATDVLAERQRQISVEGWTPEHDDKYKDDELSLAAASYAICDKAHMSPPGFWPWDRKWWKPSDNPRRNLVKAGALILAEIERLDRVQSKQANQQKD